MNIKDIARLSGVGVSTVSRVVNNHPDVKKETREHILNIIKEYNYIPNNSARVLKQSSTKNIGVLIKGIFNPFLSEMINIISEKIQDMGYMMILQHTEVEDNDIDSAIRFIKEKRLEGMICLGGNFSQVKEDTFQGIEIPIILTSVNLPKENQGNNKFSVIDIDNEQAAYMATQYLIQKGHKDICIMICDKSEAASFARYKGYQKALKQEGIAFEEENVLMGNYLVDKAYNETMTFLKNNRPTAIFAISDTMAIGVAKAVSDSGFKIGEEISIIGFDGMDISHYYTPTITTIKQPRRQMAEMSADLLFDILNEKEEHHHRILETKLVEGASCKDMSNNR